MNGLPLGLPLGLPVTALVISGHHLLKRGDGLNGRGKLGSSRNQPFTHHDYGRFVSIDVTNHGRVIASCWLRASDLRAPLRSRYRDYYPRARRSCWRARMVTFGEFHAASRSAASPEKSSASATGSSEL